MNITFNLWAHMPLKVDDAFFPRVATLQHVEARRYSEEEEALLGNSLMYSKRMSAISKYHGT